MPEGVIQKYRAARGFKIVPTRARSARGHNFEPEGSPILLDQARGHQLPGRLKCTLQFHSVSIYIGGHNTSSTILISVIEI